MTAAQLSVAPYAHYGHGLLSYLWHYFLARLLYDYLVRPFAHADGAAILAVLAGAAIAAWLYRRRARRLVGRRR